MTSLSEAREALKILGGWAGIKPGEPVGLGVEKRDAGWVIVVHLPPGYPEERAWPETLKNTPVIVEHKLLPRMKVGGRLRKGPRPKLAL